jgi:PAS domain S-box-containing protein
MGQRQATAIERPLRDDDFIVSKTDLKGRITYGNRTFAAYAGFSESQYLGQAHNLIRHPDMPRGVFKLLWATIEQGQEVFAYVKNLSSDGSFYWVFANVTPSYDSKGDVVGYYSVRRKASAKGIEAIAPLYRQMLQIERAAPSQKDGIEQSLAWVTQQLQRMGMSYEQFVLGLQK